MSRITTLLADFTEKDLTSLSEAVYGNGWQNEGAVMPFADALGTFRNILEELRSADEEALTDGMPQALQQTIETRFNNIRTYLNNTINGSSQVPNFADEVDRLHLDVWQGGFRYRGSKVLGYEAKYRQVSEIAKEIERIRERESVAKELVEEVRTIRDEVKESEVQLSNSKVTAEQQIAAINQIYAQYQQADANLANVVTNVEAKLADATESAETAEAKAQAAATHEKRLQDFIGRVDTNEQKMTEALMNASGQLSELQRQFGTHLQEAKASIDEFKETKTSELNAFVARLKGIEKDINEKLSNATGITLFHAFEKREGQIKGHWIWLIVAAVVLATVITLTACFVSNGQSADAAFYIKLSLGLPAVVFAGFALQQYGKERRLKEEYAFKSSISLSLEAYRKLVEDATLSLSDDDKARFAEFLISSIAVIFESPTERVFGTRRTGGPTDTKLIASVLQGAKDFLDTARGKGKSKHNEQY